MRRDHTDFRLFLSKLYLMGVRCDAIIQIFDFSYQNYMLYVLSFMFYILYFIFYVLRCIFYVYVLCYMLYVISGNFIWNLSSRNQAREARNFQIGGFSPYEARQSLCKLKKKRGSPRNPGRAICTTFHR